MVVFPNCKINLGLNIIRKRSDGFHDIESIFFPLKMYDAVETIQDTGYLVRFTSTGLVINGEPEDNLCIKAYQLLKKDFPQLPPLQLHLHKTIPIAAGLGGGSADAAFTLKMLNQKFDLGLSTEKLLEYALESGSDVPFFIINKPCLASGRGEILEKIDLDLSSLKFVLVYPGIPVSTSRAFSEIIPSKPRKPIRQIIQQGIATWKEELKNDFEEIIFKQHSEIKRIKEELYEAGALYASMTGSGSTVYGIFKKNASISLAFAKDFFVKELSAG